MIQHYFISLISTDDQPMPPKDGSGDEDGDGGSDG